MKNLRSPLILLFSAMGLHGACGETDDPATTVMWPKWAATLPA